MNKKQKIIIISATSVFLLLLGFRFHIEIADLFRNEKPTAEISGKKIVRKSYIGILNEARELIKNEHFALANIEIKKAIEEKPDLIEPYLVLAEMHIQQEQTSKLQTLITNLKTRFPEAPEILGLETKLFVMKGEFANAQNLLSQKDLIPQLRFYKALLVALQNDHHQAETIIRNLEKVPVRTAKANLTKEGLENVSSAERAETLSVSLAEKVKEISIIYEEFETLSDGKQPHLLALISKSLSDNNELHFARKFAETAIEEDPQYIDAWILKGYAEYLLQNYPRALLDLKKAYELDTIRAETHYFLALALEKLGQNAEAALFFEKALKNGFEFSVEIQWKLVDLFLKQKKYDQVIQIYKEIIAQNPRPEEFIPVIHNTIDIIRKPEIALEITEQLLKKNENDETALNLHGWALIANKKLDEAEKFLRKAEKLNDENPRTFLNLGLLAEKRQKFSEAIELYRQSYELGKANPHSPIANTAADRYNQLIEMDKPEVREEGRSASSP